MQHRRDFLTGLTEVAPVLVAAVPIGLCGERLQQARG